MNPYWIGCMNLCKAEGCNKKRQTKGFCQRHYKQMRKHGKILDRTIYDKNEIIIKGDIAEIVLYNKKCEENARTIIDTEDVEKVKKYKWGLADGYAKTHIKDGLVGIGDIIMSFKSTKKHIIDHTDRDKLNNRKSNYRFCTNAENQRNKPKRKGSVSKHKGVWKNGKNWMAQIMVNQKVFHLGTFKNEAAAANAYNAGAIKHHKKFAYLNKIKKECL